MCRVTPPLWSELPVEPELADAPVVSLPKGAVTVAVGAAAALMALAGTEAALETAAVSAVGAAA